MKKSAVLLVPVLWFWATVACGDTIYLKNGQVVTGKIFNENKYAVQINVQGLPHNYTRKEILRIERDTEASTPQGAAPIRRPLQEIPEAKKELVLRLLDANGTRDSISRIFSKIIAEAPQEAQGELKQILAIDEILSQVVPIYDSYYSEGELKELLIFYKSPTGQKQIRLTPQILEETLAATAKFLQKKGEEAQGQSPVRP